MNSTYIKYIGIAAAALIAGLFLGKGCFPEPITIKPVVIQSHDSVSHDTAVLWKEYPVTVRTESDTVFLTVKGRPDTITKDHPYIDLAEIHDTTVIHKTDTVQHSPLFGGKPSVLGYGLLAEVGVSPINNVYDLSIEGNIHFQKIEFFVRPQFVFGNINKPLLWVGAKYYFFRQ